jgi:hypothetical protein
VEKKKAEEAADKSIEALSSRASAFCAARDPGEPRDASRCLRRNKIARLARFLIRLTT